MCYEFSWLTGRICERMAATVGEAKYGTHLVPDGSGTLRKLQEPVTTKERHDNVTTSFSNNHDDVSSSSSTLQHDVSFE